MKKRKSIFEDITGESLDDNSESIFKDITGDDYSDSLLDNNIRSYWEPDKQINQSNQDTSGFFKSSNGNVAETIFGSAADLLVNTGKNIFSTVEGIGDAFDYGISDLSKFASKVNPSNAGKLLQVSDFFKKRANYDATGALFGESNGINLTKKGWTKDLDEKSVFGDKSDAIAQGVGSVIAFSGLGELSGGGTLESFMNSFSSSYGNARSQGIRNGMSEKDAKISGTISGLSEAISEQFFDGIPGAKSAGWGEGLVGKVGSSVEKYMGSNAGKIATKVMDSLGEGTEEIISNVLQTTGNNIAYLVDKNYKVDKENSSLSDGYQFGDISKDALKSAVSQNSVDSFVSAAISSALVNGSNALINNTQKKKILTAYAKDNNITITEAKNKLNDYVNSEMSAKENVNLPYMEKQNLNENTEYNALQKMKETTNLPTLNKYLNNKTLNNQNYSYKQGDNEKANEIQKSFTDAGFNNTKETHEFVDRALKISQDLNINIKATNNNQLMNSDFINKAVNLKIEKINNDGNTIIPEQIQQIKKDIVNQIGGFITTDDNGNKTMYLNGNSDQCINFVLGHELTHVIDDNDINKEFRKTLYDYAKTTGIYDSERSIVENIYSNGLGNVDDELTANLSGKLMMDENFVKEVYKKPTLFNTLYSKAKELYYKATGKQEKAQYETIIRTFRKVYNNKKTSNIINNNENIQYSMQDDSNDKQEEFSTKKEINRKINELNHYIYSTYSNLSDEEKNNYREQVKKLKEMREKGFGTLKTNEKVSNQKNTINDDAENISRKIQQMVDYGQDVVDDQYIDELINDSDYSKNNYIELDDYDGNLTNDEIDKHNRDIYDEMYNKIYDNLKKDGISIRYENEKSIYDRRALVEKGYNEILDYLDKNKIDYKVTKSTEPGYVPSIYLQDKEGNVILRIGNHENNYASDYDYVYNDVYKNVYKDKDYVDWKNEILPNIKNAVDNANINYEENFSTIENKEKDNNLSTNKNMAKELDNSSFSMSTDEETKKQYGTKLSDLQIKEDKTETNLPMADNIKENVNLPTYDKLKENIIEKKKEKIVKSYNNSIQDEVKRITKGTDKILYFNNSEEKRTFKKIINELYKKDNINYNDVKDIVKSNYNTRSLSYNDEYIQNIKKELRNISIQVSDNIKHDISDYKYFRQSNFGKLKLTNDGTPVDVIYSQLSEEYPETFSNEIINPTDQLYRISEVANADSVLVEDYQLDDETLKKASDFIYNAVKNKSDLNELINNISVMPKDIRSGRIKEYRELAKDYITNSATWNDTPLLKQKTNTMKRNLRDIMPLKEADNIYNEYFKPIKEHNAEINKETNNYNEKISKLNLNEKESTAVQLLGEAKYNPESPIKVEYALSYIDDNNLNKGKIEDAVKTFRETYDELFTRVNEALKSQGYKEIPYRKGYFPHFTEEHGKTIIGKMAEKLGWKFTDTSVPTDIAGLTDLFTPGKTWVSFAQERTGKNTDYNVLKGFDHYIQGAMDTIYHIEDIQKLRGLENEIRYQHSNEFLKEKFKDIEDNEYLDSEEKQKEIESLYEGFKNPLNNFVMNLHDYTNNIANKKSSLDRGVENSINRKFYNIMSNVSNRISANMVGLNFLSATTNYIPITQAYSQLSTKNTLRGMRESITTSYKNDNISNESVYLTNRVKKADKLFKTSLEKFSDKANLLFESIDEFSSNTIVRAKYYDNIDKGMSHKEALENADEFANDVMAGCSKGDMPTVFNAKNPLIKLVTAFQLEVNNQYGYMFKDMPVDLKNEGISKLISAFIKMFMGAWLYNKISEKITGRKSAFSPIDTISEIYSNFKNDKLSTYDKLAKSGEKIADDIPFVGGLIGGGRLPINAALPDFTTTIKDITELNDEKKSKTAWNSLKKELSKPVIYIAPPFGGGQVKKTIEGLSMYDTNLPIAGSYTDSGKLRFEADTTPVGKVQSALFGQYASKNAKEYFDNGETPLTSKQIQTIKDTGLSTTEYRKIKEGIKSSKGIKDSDGRYKYEDEDGNIYWYDKNNKTVYDESGNEIEKDINKLNKVSSTEQIYDYVSNLPISNEKKNTLINDELGKTDEIKDQFGYIKYIDEDGKAYWFNDKSNTLYNSKYNEVDSSKKDELTKCSNKVDISNYDNYDSLEEFQYYNKHPDKYQLIKQVGSYKNCKDYIKDIDEIKDNYSDDIDNATTPGKKSIIINKRKREIMQYINSLDLDKSQKIILYKLSGYTVKKYKNTMHNYINNLDIDYESKKSMYNSLFGED